MCLCVFVCGEKASAEAEKQQLQAEVEKLKAKNPHNGANLRSEVVHTPCFLSCA